MKSVSPSISHWYRIYDKESKKTRRKIWKLHEDSVKSDFRSYINQYRASSQKDASVEHYWNVLKGALVEATDKNGQKAQLDIEKRGGMMILVIGLVRSRN